MIVVARLRVRRPDRVALADGFLGRLRYATGYGGHPAGCYMLTHRLLFRGVARIEDKPQADRFVCWLRTLCGRRFGELVSVEST